MRGFRYLFLACVLLCATAAIQAQDGARFWLGVTGGYNTYAMFDLNDRVKEVNASADINLNEINNGNAFGVVAGVRINPQFEIFGAYERITANAEYADTLGSVEWDFPANVFYAGLQVNALRASSSRLALSGAVGLVSLSGEYRYTPSEGSVSSEDYTGSDLLAQIQLVGEYSVTDFIILSPSIGYRMAKIGSVNGEEDFLYFDYGETKMNLDYSGMIVRATLKVVF